MRGIPELIRKDSLNMEEQEIERKERAATAEAAKEKERSESDAKDRDSGSGEEFVVANMKKRGLDELTTTPPSSVETEGKTAQTAPPEAPAVSMCVPIRNPSISELSFSDLLMVICFSVALAALLICCEAFSAKN